jgi:hypothetical protein
MDGLSSLTLSAYADGRRMCRISAELKDLKDNERGLRSLSFVFTEQELEQFAAYEAALSDITHQLRIWGDSCLFFDFGLPVYGRGVAEVPYYSATIPRFVRRILLRCARRLWTRASEGGAEGRLVLDERRLRCWSGRYGTGTGQVVVAANEPTRDQLTRRLLEPATNLHLCIRQLKQIARNTTCAHFQTGTLELSKDWDGFFFRILSPRRRVTLVGGVVDHGRGNGPSWSIHT